MLVEAGSDVNRRRTKKAQEQPVFNEDMYVVHFEREKYNAIFDIKNTLRKDTTPLMVAAQYGHMQVQPTSPALRDCFIRSNAWARHENE